MKIHHKITLISSSVFAVILGLTSVLIFNGFSESSTKIFYRELARTAEIAALFYLEEDELSQKSYAPIREAFFNLSSNETVSIYNESGNLSFNTNSQENSIPESLLEEIRRKNTTNFQIENHFFHGLFYEDNQGEFVIVVGAENPFFEDQKQNLLLILIIAFLIGMAILVITTNHLSRLVYRPVTDVITQVNSLNLHKKPLLLEYPRTNDELEELFQAFNVLLSEIERTYEIQKNFIDHASHELKTPLAGIINELEITMLKERSLIVYQEKLHSILSDAVRLKSILNNLLTLSELERSKTHKFEKVRVDEVLWNVLEQLSKKYPQERFHLNYNVQPEFSNYLEISSNETLLYIAIYNFLDNAAKFSGDKMVNITIEYVNPRLQLIITDKGIGISNEDLKLLEQPFHRAKNATIYEGNGLGLSIALKILKLFNIEFSVKSELNKGTTIKLLF